MEEVQARNIYDFKSRVDNSRYGDRTVQADLISFILQLGKHNQVNTQKGRIAGLSLLQGCTYLLDRVAGLLQLPESLVTTPELRSIPILYLVNTD